MIDSWPVIGNHDFIVSASHAALDLTKKTLQVSFVVLDRIIKEIENYLRHQCRIDFQFWKSLKPEVRLPSDL